METKDLIKVEVFCVNYNIEISFFNSLHEYGLVKLISIDNATYIAHEQLANVEKIINWHFDLHINLEGIEVISNLLDQISDLQKQLIVTQNKLNIFDLD